ncbi:F0F1 ATP synthase subunit B [Candidatus Purcelliella pentastirinorum]|uniref:F0F1 ATP synthase subunit B n=1 Tax=Candidatus Purcelliella pentastirinorum TaxID=472834 RepID=UPI002367CD82|nr:F0F1 ATP synthase subunit B [Candidatus Purcelliella pentastirinorum]WDI78799.1 F0F1 ATP synthase subunit B [Candidatus Purcelliella pentastirinorum]WDR79932.1 F0F1 ATP synthase subunit B [Candidatus Purcelliella pentastirinorum]
MNINSTLFGEIISFLLFIFFCMKYIWPPIIDSINKREKKIYNAILSVDKAKIELSKIKMQTINEINETKKTCKLILDQTNKDKIDILEETKLEIIKEQKKIIKESYLKIENEYEITKEKLRKETVLLVIYCLEKVLNQSMDANINKKIVNKFISSLKKYDIYA